jgi:hypothetical protein
VKKTKEKKACITMKNTKNIQIAIQALTKTSIVDTVEVTQCKAKRDRREIPRGGLYI